MIRWLASVGIAAVLLFVWGGVAQLLPWGLSTVQNVTTLSTEDERFKTPASIHVSSDELTTPSFDMQFDGRISTYVTERTFSWIVTQPLAEGYSGYFIREALTQLLIAALLSTLLAMTRQWTIAKRLAMIATVAIMASTSTYGSLMNWWALPTGYGLGVSLNLLVGWLVTSWICASVALRKV